MDLQDDRTRAVSIAAALFVSTVAAYGAVTTQDFVNFDDLNLVVRNPHLTVPATPSTLAAHFGRPFMGNWLPLHWISLHLGYSVHGANPVAFKLTNVALHAIATVLLFLALRRMTRELWPSAFVAAVFGLHPIHVESVAWVAERKDVLSGFFWMLGLYAYALFAEQPRSPLRYLGVLTCFVLGLMSKATLVVFPFVLLLLDAWPLDRLRGRVREAVLEKLPMVLLSATASVVTYFAHSAVGNTRIGVEVGWLARFVNAFESYWLYLGDSLWPTRLAAMYPHPYVEVALTARDVLIGAGLALGLGAITALFHSQRTKRPYLLVGWLWYLGVLVPMIGFVHVGLQARADRYMYLPSVGLTIIVAFAVADWVRQDRRMRPLVIGAASISLLAMVALTSRQVTFWNDSITLFSRMVEVTDRNRFAHENLAVFLGGAGRTREAAEHFEAALAIDPRRTVSRFGLATMYERLGEDRLAIEQYRAGIGIHPRKVRAHGALGILLVRTGQAEEAEEHLRYALKVLPDEAAYRLAMGQVEESLGRPESARVHFDRALRLDPSLDAAAEGIARLDAAPSDGSAIRSAAP